MLRGMSAVVTTNSLQPVTEPWKPMAVRSALCIIFSALGWWMHDRQHSVSTAFFMVAYLFGAWDMAIETWHDLREIKFDTHFLMLTVAPCAAAIGAWGEGALLLILFSASATMEEYAMGRSRGAINALLRGAPKTATVVEGGVEREVEVESLAPGMRVRVKAGQQVPVDFRVDRGESACDEASLTGESTPVPKGPGDEALSGTLNLSGVIEGVALRPASESALQRIIRLIETSQSMRAPSQRLADRFGTRYTGLVLGTCAVMFLWWWKGKGLPAFFPSDTQPSAFYRAMTLLTVASPCALVLSVPSAILSAIAFGARHGVLFRGGAAVERLADVGVVALDKTGTLTAGDLHVVRVETRRGDETAVLRAAGALAALSTHPVSRSVYKECARRGLALPHASADETVPGKGVRGTVEDRRVSLGNRAMLALDRPGDDVSDAPPPPEHGSETWVASDAVLGRILLQDTLRPEAGRLLAQLHDTGVETVMLTGDRQAAAERIGRECGIGSVRAGLHPEDKVAAVQELKAGGRVVAMVGDGINDSPCLAAADVGVAMGARGSDAALEQADVVLMNDRLENFLLARDLSRRARRVMRQNIVISLGTIVVMVTISLLPAGVPLWVGVAAHEGSTALVVLNSLRLLVARRG